MFSRPTPQRNNHEVHELHDCGHTTKHPCLYPEKGNAKTHKCTYRVPIEDHGVGVRRLCPTCTFAQATRDENNPGSMRKWWKEDMYVNYMEDTVEQTVTLTRSDAIKAGVSRVNTRPRTPLIRSTSVHPDRNPLFGTPPSRDRVPAQEAAKKDEGKETKAKKPSRMASVKTTIKRLLSFRKKPVKEEEKNEEEDEEEETEEEKLKKRQLRQRSLSAKSIKYTAKQLEDMRRDAGGEHLFNL